MASPTQTIMFTAMPRAIGIDPPTLPVAVLVSPRLTGAPTLTSFPDWLDWTGQLKRNGLKVTFTAGGQTHTEAIDTNPLQPALWSAIFDKATRVDDYVFDDYSQRLVLSYPNRATLTLLKSIFQIGGLQLALPGQADDEGHGKRRLLLELIDGLAVNWNDDRRRGWRDALRNRQQTELLRLAGDVPSGVLNPFRTMPGMQAAFTAGDLGGDGLPNATQLPPPGSPQGQSLRHELATQFALYHHLPPAPSFVPPDMSSVIDFHKAITALQAYPALLRALGLVFDLHLPTSFLPLTPTTSYGTFGVASVTPGWSWAIQPAPIPPARTAYDYLALGGHKLFLTAPRQGLNSPDPSGEIVGLLNLDPRDFGLAQVDIDGAMHKTIILAEGVGNTAPPIHPEVFDPTSTLPSLRSAGLALVSDTSALALLKGFQDAKVFNDALSGSKPQPRPFFAEDLVRGFRLDVWDSHTRQWHSLHRRDAVYTIKDQTFNSRDEEGFTHLAVTGGAPGSDPARINDFYLQEAIARWAGWSLSVPPLGKHLTRSPDPDKAVPPDDPNSPDFDPENPPATPFQMTTAFTVVKASLPSLRFGRGYRVRARAVDLAGNSLTLGDPLTDALGTIFGTPRDPEGFAYLRYEPVAAPVILLRDAEGVSSPGSAIDRLVIRTFNDDPTKDGSAADLTGSERHIVPPRTSVELGERLGMFDDGAGRLRADAATYDLIRQRDEGKFNTQIVPGQTQPMPIEAAAQASIPYLPDVLARGAALRDLPGAGNGTAGNADPGASANPIAYPPLEDANPRPGSVTLVDFAGAEDWTKARPFRLVLADGAGAPAWDAAARALTIYLPKAMTGIVPLSSFIVPADLRLMGVWQWIREYFDALARTTPISEDLWPGSDADVLTHIIQRAVEGGHWMLTPPHLLTLVHAVQQPIGHPHFTQVDVQHPFGQTSDSKLQSENMSGPTSDVALATLSSWRTLKAIDAYLIGGLRVHGASTAKIDLLAEWDDPIDDGITPPTRSHQQTHADEIPLQGLDEGYLTVTTGASTTRAVGYYAPAHDLICFVRKGDILSATLNGVAIFEDAAPRHHFNDTRHHRVTYVAVATSRFRDYFTPTLNPADSASPPRVFTRASQPVQVDIPASARPDAPKVLYVVPTFGWERQSSTNLKRSIRFGGGLRVYMDRPWYSSGDGELLGVVLYNEALPINREAWKPHITQWGLDPVWDAAPLWSLPAPENFPLSVAQEYGLSLEEPTPPGTQGKGRVSAAGHDVRFDGTYWYCDITVETYGDDYSPFIRLALARYQPHALDDAKLSRVVLADFAQFLPDRSLLVTADPYHPRRLRVTISGPVPLGPRPVYPDFPPLRNPPTKPTQVVITVQERDPAIAGDLGWREAAAGTASISVETDGQFATEKYLALWSGSVQFAEAPRQGQFRLLIREYEYISADWAIVHPGGEALPPWSEAPGRLIYAETVLIDEVLVGPTP
jgi:hypothetical protein